MSLRAYYIIINYCCPRLSKGALTYLCNSVLGLSTADGGNVVNREIIMEEGGKKSHGILSNGEKSACVKKFNEIYRLGLMTLEEMS